MKCTNVRLTDLFLLPIFPRKVIRKNDWLIKCWKQKAETRRSKRCFFIQIEFEFFIFIFEKNNNLWNSSQFSSHMFCNLYNLEFGVMDRHQVWTMGIWSAQTDNFSVEHLMKHKRQNSKAQKNADCSLQMQCNVHNVNKH